MSVLGELAGPAVPVGTRQWHRRLSASIASAATEKVFLTLFGLCQETPNRVSTFSFFLPATVHCIFASVLNLLDL